MWPFHRAFFSMAVVCVSATVLAPAWGQLRITEVMYNPLSTDDAVWEWIEVQNLGVEVDLNGAFVDGLNDFDPPIGALPNISNTVASNTVIPAGGVAVLYDGFQATGSPLNYNDALFREAWGLGTEAPIIAVDFWPGLSNSGDPTNLSFGIWADRTAYDMDITGTPGEGQVTSFANTLASVNYDVTDPWPGSTNGVSISYTGNGDITSGANWVQSSPSNGATTSVPVQIEDFINSPDDAGNPGLQSPFGGSPPSGQLLITEVMFNPRSNPDNDFEWIEVLNTTGSAVDFSTVGHFLDDSFNENLMSPNVTTGSIADGESAVLFNDNLLTVSDMEAIWGDDINFIPVSDWSALNNGGDTIGLWDSQAEYDADAATGDEGSRGVTMAAASLIYSTDDQAGWPVPDGNGSIWLPDLAADPSQGESWIVAADNDGFGISYNATGIGGVIDVHPGGDVGSPGSFVPDTGGTPGDYNDDGVVNAADYVVWRNNEGENFTLPNERPDAATPGVPDTEDYTFWVSQFGSGAGGASVAVPEPGSVALALMALLSAILRRRGVE